MLTDPQLKSKVDALWDRFWPGGLSNPLTAIEQMSYPIFLKRLEDMDNARAAASEANPGCENLVAQNLRMHRKQNYW